MLNTEEFTKRIEIILNYYNYSAATFADKIGIQRSSLSHLLSGRNKPSLDFILKMVTTFPEIDLEWILFGKGNFPKNDSTYNIPEGKNKIDVNPTLFEEIIVADKEEKNSTHFPPNLEQVEEKVSEVKNESQQSSIERIVFFYTNGSFKEYIPN